MSVVAPDPAHALTPSGNLRRRLLVSRLFVWVTIAAAALAVAVLFILVYYVAKQGASRMSLSFLTAQLPLTGVSTGTSGGIGPAIVGSAEIVAISTAIALPIGVLTAIYLTEFAHPRIAGPVQTALESLAGLPTIIAGIFVAGLLVDHFGQSAYAAGVALSVVQVPLIARASMESIRRVPHTLREAADALGVARWRTITGVVLPTASGGIVTATILAIARAAGETAPVLFTSSAFGPQYQLNPTQATPNLPFEIYTLVNSGFPADISAAWGAAFFLIVLILVTNIAARVWLRRSERKRGL
jgi:phosphate transport system permease protein